MESSLLDAHPRLQSTVFLLGLTAGLVAACGGSESPSGSGPAGDAGGAGGAAVADAGDTAPAIQEGTLVHLPEGDVQGTAEGGARRFASIPFAKPPTGDRRFAAPEVAEPWGDVLDATSMPPRCAQPTSLNTGEGTDNEDCLYLNVWTPDPAPTRPLPVLVWIHGGGNENGATSDLVPIVGERLFYDGHSFAAHHDVVVVSMNYRLGVFGYLAHPAMAEAGLPPGNLGLLDQRLALEWVRDHIAVFGGDADRVTLFGESAGARNVCFHVVSPSSRGLFQAAISQSGECTARHWPTRAEAEADAVAFADFVGCGSASDVIACLRGKPASELIVEAPLVGAVLDPAPGGPRYSGGVPAWGFGPSVDGDFLPVVPREAFASGDVAQVPYLMGTNTDEGALAHLTAPPVADETEFLQALELAFGDFADRIAEVYSVAEFPTPNDALVRVTTDSRYACAVQDFAERATAAGLPVYAYNFDEPYAIPGLESLGKAHGAELPFVFKSLAPEWWPPGAEAVADLMQGYWSRFATSHDPNGGGAPEWPAFSSDRGNRLELGTEPAVLEGFRAERCAVWRDVFAAEQ